MTVKIGLIVVGIIFGAIAVIEVGLRLFGFGNPLIYQADSEIGYLLAPDQQVRRMGNRIKINQYSMRGDDLDATRPSDSFRIMLLGDSVANGGWWTDQDMTISAQLLRQLNQDRLKIQVLNASANSWGPRNQLAYLRRFGTFEAQVIVLLINTDDLFALPPSTVKVGKDVFYPDQRPPLALSEIYQRWRGVQVEQPKESGDRVGKNLAAIEAINKIATENGADLIIAITPLLREVENNERDYESKARGRLEAFAQQKQIQLIDFLPLFKRDTPASFYRDHIHLSPTGNELVSQTVAESLTKILHGELDSNSIKN